MRMDTRKSTHIIGRRTRVNVLQGKTIRKHGDGGDVFEDYWTDSDEEISNHSTSSSHFFDLSVKSQNVLSNQTPSDFSDSNQMEAMSQAIRQTPERKAKLSKSSVQTTSPLSSKILQVSAMSENVKRTPARKTKPSTPANSPLSSKTLHMKTMSEIVRKTPEGKTKLSNSSTQANSPLSSKTFSKNKMSSSMHLQKHIVRNLDKEVLLEMSSSTSSNEGEELVLSASMQNNSGTAKLLQKNKVKRKSTLLTEKILSNYDKYDAVIMKMIDGEEENNDRDSPRHSTKNASPNSDISKLNDDDITHDLSPVDNNNEPYNIDTHALTSIENINNKSVEINSTQSFRDNEISSLSSHTSEKELPIKEMQTILNVSKSVNKPNKVKENSQRTLNASNSEKKKLNSMTYDKSISNIAESQSNDIGYFDTDKVPVKTHTKNKRKSLKSRSSHRHIDYDSNIQEDINEANSPLKSVKKHKNSSETFSLRQTVKFAANSNAESKKQADLDDETNNVTEYEHNVSNHKLQQLLPNTAAELHFSESTSSEKSNNINETNEFERQAGKEDGQASRKQNSSNCSNEQDQLPIDSLSPKRDDISSKGKRSTELEISQNQVNGKGEEISQFNSRNRGELTSVMNSVRNEQLPSMSDDNHLSLGSKRKHSSQSNSTERKSRNKKIKNKSTFAKPSEHELQQISVNNLSPIQELCANNPQSPKNARNVKCPLTKSKTRRKKFHSEEEVRRSGRQRYAPLAHWRNERLLYRFEKGEIKILGIDEGFGGDDFKTPNAFKKNKGIKPPRIKKISLYDNKLQKKTRTCMYKPFRSVEWTIFDENTPYRIKRVFDTVNSAFGYLQIDAFEKKPLQRMPEEDVHLTVIAGEVEINVQKESFKVQAKDMFIIPRCTAYSITNITNRKALLSFSVGKFKFLEHAQ